MKPLLLLLAALLVAPAASAQWSFESDFPADGSIKAVQNHGLAVDGEGKVWIQSYYPFTGDSVAVDPAVVANSSAANCNKTTNNCRVTATYVLNPDGTQASFSPISIVTLPGGVADTLGGEVILNDTGQKVWSYNTNRGLTTLPDGNVLVTVFNTLYKFDAATGEVLDFVAPTNLDPRGATAAGVDAAGNVFVTGVFSGDPIAAFDANLDPLDNVVDADGGFNRAVLVLPDGNTVFALNYSEDEATIYQRPDEFTAFDSVGVTFQGMSVESATLHPVTGNIWASAGSPNDPPSGRYQPHTWYEFTVADVLANAMPTPLDSIVWNNPGDGRPRAIAFSPDGKTAYVGEFNLNTPAVQKFVQGAVAAEAGPDGLDGALQQNAPNPFRGETAIRFSLTDAAQVTLKVYDTAGRQVASLVDGPLAAGSHETTFRADHLAAGVYVYALTVDGQSAHRQMLVVR